MGSQIVFTMKSLIFLFISVLWIAESKTPPPYEGMDKYVSQYELPDLPYEYDQLEPFIDEETVAIHYEEHHYEYTNNLNSAIGMWRAQSPTLGMRSLIEILINVDEIKEPYHGAIKQFAGG
ncbi:superoxide dismutase [Mn]-like, partial [Saccoglossus kowalevskii]|uniref:superoxide dismutase n=1 Tax=Saccoglossus kowalevskii TaxID=10224 RepID=A0ABM0MCU7_SACKO